MENISVRAQVALKWSMRALLAVAIASGLALFALLVWSADNASRFARQYDWLLLLNGVLAVALMVWVLVMALRLARQIRRRQFGARLTGRFARSFALVGMLPGVIVYLLSVQFMSRSIESWFNVRVENALEAGLSLGRSALDQQLAELTGNLQAAARDLGQTQDADLAAALLQLREQAGADEAMIFTASGRPLAFSSSRYGQLIPAAPPAHVLNQLRVARLYAAAEEPEIEAGSGPGNPANNPATNAASTLKLRVVVPIAGNVRGASLSASSADVRWLQAVQTVPEAVARNANLVQQGFSDYQELALSRLGLRKLYGITLTLALVLSIFAAIMAALTLSRRLVRPLLRLAAGTQAVAVGDYRPLPEPPSRDELGQLTRSFNAMTRQLDEARRMVQANRQQLERSNVYLESVLGNLSSGVLVFDQNWRVILSNQGAQNILQLDLQAGRGEDRNKALQTEPTVRAFVQHIRQAFEAHAAVESERRYWQQQFELQTAVGSDGTGASGIGKSAHVTTLLARGSYLPDVHDEDEDKPGDKPDDIEHGEGKHPNHLVVFDDISEVISANRAVAWAEVGRRLAHEIKNPLTPIQLSAERLAHKLADKLEPSDADVLQRSTNTIVNQVTSLKRMVDEFREYARTPPLQCQPLNLNALVAEVLTLYGWNMDADAGTNPMADPATPRFVTSLEDDLPDIEGDAVQLRQVLHNLLANAREAVQANAGITAGGGRIEVQTRRVNTAPRGGDQGNDEPLQTHAVRLTISDNGTGFDAQVLARAFEPYVTTKAGGTGLGLAIVRKIIEGHGGRLDVSNRRGGGARISILFTRLAITLAAMDDNSA